MMWCEVEKFKGSIKPFFKLLRVSHWSKAGFVFLGTIYSGAWNFLLDAFLAAFAFCLISSAVYIYNDIQDREEDKRHPKKCHRPLASEKISLEQALITIVILLLSGLALAWSVSTMLLALLDCYLLLNIVYNHFLKNLLVVDVLCIASGFMLRVLAGTIGIGLTLSYWLVFSATLISLFIALCKRRSEKQLDISYATRAVLKKYSIALLDGLIIIIAIGSFLTYIAYLSCVHADSFYFLLTLPFAAIGLGRFTWLSRCSKDNDDPVSLFLSDKLSCFNLLCFITLTLIAL